MIRVRFLPLCFAVLFALLAGCSPARFTGASMVVDLPLPDDFRWAQTPVTLYEAGALAARIGPDSRDLLEHNWQSSTFGQLVSEQVTIRIAVHRFASHKDAAAMLAQHKYPDAQPLKIGTEAYRWLDRNADETIFFRRGVYFAQLTIDPPAQKPLLDSLGAELDKLLAQ